VLPFYILHQPVILILGYFIIPLPLTILTKYLLIAPLAFGITLGLYEFGIRRVNLVRRLFDLKPLKQSCRLQAWQLNLRCNHHTGTQSRENSKSLAVIRKGWNKMNAQSTDGTRKYELDWLRVTAIFAVFVYHCSMIFAPDPFQIKNPTLYPYLDDLGALSACGACPHLDHLAPVSSTLWESSAPGSTSRASLSDCSFRW
jgi:hypothetical protein